MAKFCKDCRHFIPAGRMPNNPYLAPSARATLTERCRRPEAADLVNGEPRSCREMRGIGQCGKAGSLFEPKGTAEFLEGAP